MIRIPPAQLRKGEKTMTEQQILTQHFSRKMLEERDVPATERFARPEWAVCTLPTPQAMTEQLEEYRKTHPGTLSITLSEAITCYINAWFINNNIRLLGTIDGLEPNYKNMVFNIGGENCTVKIHGLYLVKTPVPDNANIVPIEEALSAASQKSYEIVDSTGETPEESAVLILADERVIYHELNSEENIDKNYDDDKLWCMGDLGDWEIIFGELEDEDVARLSAYSETWDNTVSAQNIYTYITYYACVLENPDWTWKEFKGEMDEYNDKIKKEKENDNGTIL